MDSLNQLTNPAAPAAFVYDLNGNLRTNGTQVLDYDAENQLSSVTVAGDWRSEFQYDFAGRLRVRKEYTWTSGNWVLTSEVRYLYDGMLVIQERDGNNAATGELYAREGPGWRFAERGWHRRPAGADAAHGRGRG